VFKKSGETELGGLRRLAADLGSHSDFTRFQFYEVTAARLEHGVVQSKAHLQTVSRESWHVELKSQSANGPVKVRQRHSFRKGREGESG
jgi:hypothetical protein